MSSSSGQKLIGKNRAPRVQIEYEVESYGSQKKIELPFVMGVLADLLGTPEAPPVKIEQRKFLEIDADNFDDRLKAMKPRAVLTVDNTLTGEGKLPLALTFESMDDFSPAAIASKVEPLRALIEARQQLKNLIAYMDGKGEAEELLSEQLKDPAQLRQLVASLGLDSQRDAASTSPTEET